LLFWSGYNPLAWITRDTVSRDWDFDELSATLPFWLPADATLETLGATTNISVLEFNIIP